MKRQRRDRGFTLIEIIMTTLILVLGFLIIASSYVAMARANRYSERQDTAINLASRVMEDLRNTRFDQIVSGEGTYGEYTDFPGYRHQTEVVDVGQVKQVTVRVFFNNNQRQIMLVSFFANI
jgi:prepilin-type N-terminal cleavage/methylation domain-containing protein